MTGKQLEIFGSPDSAGQSGATDVRGAVGSGWSPAAESVSIKWYAEKQHEYYEAGMRSAGEYWRARDVKFP